MAFPPLGNSDHVVVSVSIDFQTYSQHDAPFHCTAYDYSGVDWDGLCDHLRDVPWEEVPFSMRVSIQSDSKIKLRQASNRCKRVLEAAKLTYANKTKESITSQKLGSRDFWCIANSVLNKGKSAIPLYSTGQRCCLLQLIKQNCLLKIFL